MTHSDVDADVDVDVDVDLVFLMISVFNMVLFPKQLNSRFGRWALSVGLCG